MIISAIASTGLEIFFAFSFIELKLLCLWNHESNSILQGCRDYIHIMDIAKGHVAALKQIVEPTFTGVKIYNLGTGTGVTVLQIVKAFEEATGKKIPYEIVDRLNPNK